MKLTSTHLLSIGISVFFARLPFDSLNAAKQEASRAQPTKSRALESLVQTYLETKEVDPQKERVLAMQISKELVKNKATSTRTIMLWCRDCRRKMWPAVSSLKEEVIFPYGSLGVALFFNNEKERVRAVRVMIREAWLFSRAARTFLWILTQNGFKALPEVQRATLLNDVKAFYRQAALCGRMEEANHLVALGAQSLVSAEEVKRVLTSMPKAAWQTQEARLTYALSSEVRLKEGTSQAAATWQHWWKGKRAMYKKKYQRPHRRAVEKG